MERGSGIFVDFGLEGGLEGLVGIVRAEEVGVADCAARTLVVVVNGPTGDALCPIAMDFAVRHEKSVGSESLLSEE